VTYRSLLITAFIPAAFAVTIGEQGVALYNARKLTEAKSVLLPFGEKDPVAAFHLGQIMMGENEDGKAADREYQAALELNPKYADAEKALRALGK